MFYNTLFVVVYKFFLDIDAGHAYQTKNNRASATVCSITLFQLLNLLTFYNNPSTIIVWSVIAIIFVFNVSFFLSKNRFLKILNALEESPQKFTSRSFVYLYLIGTILGFAATRDFN